MTHTSFNELGRTWLLTARQRRRFRIAVACAALCAAAAAAASAALISTLGGGGPRFPRIRLRSPVTTGFVPRRPGPGVTPEPDGPSLRMPVTVSWPTPPGWPQTVTVVVTAVLAATIWGLLMRWIWPRLLQPVRGEARHRGLATPAAVRAAFGPRPVRRAGRYTLPGTTRRGRALLPTAAFGYCVGHYLDDHPARTPGGHKPRAAATLRRWRRGPRIWADWEQRIRIIARTGWAKTFRLLIPITRALPGPAMVASTEPQIFEYTVTVRQRRRTTLRSPTVTRLVRRWLPEADYPVAVVDFTAPHQRYAAGYPRVRYSPITGAEDFIVAHRHAVALVSGVDTADPGRPDGDSDQFWRDSAAEVLAAWLHAAALGDKDIDDILAWNRDTTDPVPRRILRDDPRATRSALTNLDTHLDSAAEKTTSGVRRYLTLATNSLATDDARELCGRRGDPQFDMGEFIRRGGTLYLLTDADRADRARPLLSLIATEMFLAATAVALSTPRRRLPQPFIAVLDELRYAVTIPNLPYVANALRKFGIGYVYAVQSSSQEDRVYGADAPALRAAAGLSIYGGIDIDAARELTDRAGPTPVVTATRGTHAMHPTTGQRTSHADRHSERIQHQPALTIADQQQLPDGAAVVIARGVAPFFVHTPDFRDRRRHRRPLDREAAAVASAVATARARDLAIASTRTEAQAVGANIPTDTP